MKIKILLICSFLGLLFTTSCQENASLAPSQKSNAVNLDSDPNAKLALTLKEQMAGVQSEFHTYMLSLPLSKEYTEDPIWDQTRSLTKGDTSVFEVPFEEKNFKRRTLTAKRINGRNLFTIKIENFGPPYSALLPSVQYIHFPRHSDSARGGRVLAGGHNCGSCHNYAWWDTFDEVTIIGTAPANNDPFVPDYWGGNQSYNNGTVIYPYSTYAVDLLDNPCLSSVFNQMRKGRFDNKVQQILTNFDLSSSFKFTIDEAFMADKNTNATVTVSAAGPLITLNTNALAYASQEFIAKVIYHEALHVFLNGQTNQADHNTMATKFVEPMAQGLMSWFSLSPTDARGLAWSGLKGTPAWNALSPSEQLSYKGIGDRFKNLDNGYNHQYGHACP
ncbi:hypothetical protein [Dyadobacter sp. 676]|uniref:DUF4157 domain-containing protein n=1 Tax=Dyadobacter sp. 676 TaxID=3088362 RepID=A0AAU8FM22_9BACT